MAEIQTLVVGALSTNCYLISDRETGETLVVDPGDAPEYISDVLAKQSLTPIAILATHGHFDHVMGALGVQTAFTIPFFIHRDDLFLLSRMRETATHFLRTRYADPPPVVSGELYDGQRILVGGGAVTVLHVPGHTPGSVAFLDPDSRSIIVGDTFFADGSRGRTDTSYGNPLRLSESVRMMSEIADIALAYPGHGEAFTPIRAKRKR